MELTTLAKITTISTNHANPEWAEGQMQAVLKENLKLVNRVTQSMLLTELTRRRIPLKDVRSIEIKQRWQGREKKDKALIDFLMKRKKKVPSTRRRCRGGSTGRPRRSCTKEQEQD